MSVFAKEDPSQVGHLLESRPEQNELVKTNIIKNASLSGRIQQAQKALQHNMTTDRVGHLLEKRSEIDSLQSQVWSIPLDPISFLYSIG